MPGNSRLAFAWVLAATLLFGAGAFAAISERPAPAGKRADIRVEGLGWLRDRSMRQTLMLLLGEQRGATLNAGAIEDAALIVFSDLNQSGYLEPTLDAVIEEGDGKTRTYPIDPTLERSLPRGIAAVKVILRFHQGLRFNLVEVDFDGLTAMHPDQARTYFRGEGILAAFTSEQAYSPARLQRSAETFAEELRRRGFAEAKVAVASVVTDHKKGAVRVRIAVHQGPLWRVDAVQFHVSGGVPPPKGLNKPRVGSPWSPEWLHDAQNALRRHFLELGYPDVKVTLTPQAGAESAGVRSVTVLAEVSAGERVTLGTVRFKGNFRTKESALSSRVHAKEGEPLNPLQLEDGRYRISRLGIFDTVDLRYDPPSGSTRDAIYDLTEAPRQTVDVLLGWGSYDELRGGVTWSEYNLFGLGHEGTLKVVQSMKSSDGEYDYTVPELFGSSSDGTAKIFGFRRSERSFVDQVYGTTLSVSTPLPALGVNLVSSYTFERLKAENDTLATVLADLTHASATSVKVAVARDRRDNALIPHNGYKVSIQAEEAGRWLGGTVDFQNVQFAASYHTNWGASRWIHLGFQHALITTFGAPAGGQVPVDVLFYPGGDDSIRGYGYGQAAPRAANGQFLGAKTFTLLNVELEQALTSKLSLVAFSDSLGAAARLAGYPFDTRLYSAGLGIRLQTLIGPIRLEYGRNLNPRPGDPAGTVQFSVGFPF